MSDEVLLVALRREGGAVVFTVPGFEGENASEFECNTPEELWRDLHEVLRDPSVPKAQVSAAPVGPGGPQGEGLPMDPDHVYESACEQIEFTVGEAYGPMFGNVAGRVARTGGKSLFRLLRKVSR